MVYKIKPDKMASSGIMCDLYFTIYLLMVNDSFPCENCSTHALMQAGVCGFQLLTLCPIYPSEAFQSPSNLLSGPREPPGGSWFCFFFFKVRRLTCIAGLGSYNISVLSLIPVTVLLNLVHL